MHYFQRREGAKNGQLLWYILNTYLPSVGIIIIGNEKAVKN